MLRVFGQTEKNFSSNGDIVLRPLKAKIRKEDNGAFYLDLETGIDYEEYIPEGAIVVANTPQGDQPFRVANVTKTRSKLSARALHVFYDSQNYLIADSYVVNKNCNDALDHLNIATEPQSGFTTASDITTVNSYRCVRKSLYEAVMEVVERWGGHLVRDNFSIAVRSQIGRDNGVTVQYRKNLKSISCATNWDNVVTQLMPVGRDGILLPEKYIRSEIQYDLPYTKAVSFDQSHIEEQDYTDADGNTDETAYRNALIDDLRRQAQAYIGVNCIPKVNYTLSANIDVVTDIGDTVRVDDDRLGIDILTNVIAYEYDCILKEYTLVEFGNFRQTLSNLMQTINAQTRDIVSDSTEAVRVVLGAELQQATDRIWNAMSDSYVIYDGDKILVVDRLPKETAQNCIMINSGGIGFSSTGINGTFNSAWTIDGTLNMQSINVINLTANLIKGGTLKLGSNLNESGLIELYDSVNNLIGVMDSNGLRMYGQDGSYVLMNQEVGFAGFDRNGTKIYWASQDEFHMRKSVVEQEITLCNQVRFIPITIMNGTTIVNEGIGLVSAVSGGV